MTIQSPKLVGQGGEHERGGNGTAIPILSFGLGCCRLASGRVSSRGLLWVGGPALGHRFGREGLRVSAMGGMGGVGAAGSRGCRPGCTVVCVSQDG